MAQAQYHSLHEMLTVGAPRTAASAAPLAIALLRGLLLQLALLLPDASAGRRAVGVVTERYSEGIMTWDDDLEERGAATLQVAGMLGIECGSTIVGQGVDSLIFYPLAFYGAPDWPVEAMLAVMLSQFLLKVGWEVLLTPVTYLVVGWLKRREGIDVYDAKTDFTPFRTKV